MPRCAPLMIALVVAALAGCAAPGAQEPTPLFTQDELSEPTEQSEPTAEPTVAGPIDACALLPQAEAEALAGTALAPGAGGDPSAPSCTYNPPPDGPTAQVEVYAGDGAKKFYDIDVELGHTFTSVDGIGDEAHLEENTIFFRKDATWVAIRLVLLNDPAENAQRLQDAARAAAGRL